MPGDRDQYVRVEKILRSDDEHDPAELARIDVGEMMAIFEIDKELCEPRSIVIVFVIGQRSRHSEMEHQPSSVADAGEEMLAVPLCRLERLAHEGALELA